jgi:RNA polymerase sigma-70 factor (ECF subfamily)
MDETTDRALVLRTRNGEVDAFGELVRRYQSSVFNVCYRLLRERREAEDLTQEAFIRAYQRLETFDVERAFGPWIRRVGTNLCYNHLQRRQQPQVSLEEERDLAFDADRETPETALTATDRTEALRRAIVALPPPYRVVIELRHYQELSYAEIAETLGTPISQVKSHLFRARKALAKSIHPEDI